MTCVRPHILLADDDPMVRRITGDMLRLLGYDVTLCGDGEEALAYLRKAQDGVDIVLLDGKMPVLSGQETFAQMRTIKPDLKGLLASGYGSANETRALLDAGFCGFIQKPHSLDALDAALQAALGTPAGEEA